MTINRVGSPAQNCLDNKPTLIGLTLFTALPQSYRSGNATDPEPSGFTLMRRLLNFIFNKKPVSASGDSHRLSPDAPEQADVSYAVMTLCNDQRFAAAEELISHHAANGLSAGTASMLRGNIALTQKRFDAAVVHFHDALNQHQHSPAIYINLAMALSQLTMPFQALAVIDEAVQRFGTSPQLMLLRAEALLQIGDLDNGVAALLELLSQPDAPPGALTLLINAWLNADNAQQACKFLATWQSQHASDALPYALLGISHYKLHELAASEKYYREALARNERDAETWDNLGVTLNDLGRLDAAIACYNQAIALHPNNPVPCWHRALAYLLDGSFDVGWPDYELRTLNKDLQTGSTAFPRWTGHVTPKQTVLIFGEQGLGDEIMFASCIPHALTRINHAVVHCHPKLETLFRRSFPACTITSGALLDALALYPDDAPLIDAALPSGSLPSVLQYDPTAIASPPAYLRADPQHIAAWRERLAQLGTGLKIGISWRGGTPGTRQALRSLQLEDWLPVLRQANAHFISLQYTDVSTELTQLEQRHGLRIAHWQEAIEDYDQTAALVSALDLVISVQTAVIHLSGALGQRTWVMVPACPEWRYQRQGARLPWYSNVTLYRQNTLLDWRETIGRVAADLAPQVLLRQSQTP